MSSESDGYVSFIAGLLFGMAVGSVLGILLTPKTGKEIRSDIGQLKNEIPDNISHGIDETKDICNSTIDKAKYTIDKKIKKINDSIKAGKMAIAKKNEEHENDLVAY